MRESPGVAANVLDWVIILSEFELQSRWYVLFRTNTLGETDTLWRSDNVMDCGIKLQSRSHVHFRTNTLGERERGPPWSNGNMMDCDTVVSDFELSLSNSFILPHRY